MVVLGQYELAIAWNIFSFSKKSTIKPFWNEGKLKSESKMQTKWINFRSDLIPFAFSSPISAPLDFNVFFYHTCSGKILQTKKDELIETTFASLAFLWCFAWATQWRWPLCGATDVGASVPTTTGSMWSFFPLQTSLEVFRAKFWRI